LRSKTRWCITYIPAAHEMHVDEVVEPVTVLYLPSAHKVHELCAEEL
jgi:hypothetical protein